MPHQPSVTGIESRHGVPQSPVADDSWHWQVPERTTLATPQAPQPPAPGTVIVPDDPEFERKVWAYIRNQLLRLQGTNVQ